MFEKGICRICGAIHIKDSQPDFMASGKICANCYYKHTEPNDPYYGINKPKESK